MRHNAPVGTSAPSDEALLADQRAYYRQRAPEYDEWWQRVGRYDHGEQPAREWERQVAVLEGALESFGPTGEVLELAGGTGWWTARLARVAPTLTVLDASPETLAINRRRVPERPGLSYVVADLFTWEPERRYDTVFFSFWLSHVPRARFAAFWQLVGRCLQPEGRVFLIDNRQDLSRTFVEPHILDKPEDTQSEEPQDVQRRTLNDGSKHRLVKVFYEPTELAGRLAAEGWHAEIADTPWFIYGAATRRPGLAGENTQPRRR